jgi:hypothetical protein
VFNETIRRAFLFIYGLQGIYALLFDSNPMGDDLKMMNPQYMMSGGGPQQPKDFAKLFESERDSYDLMDYKFVLDKAESYLIKKHNDGTLF